MESIHSPISHPHWTLQTQSHSTFYTHGIHPLTNLTPSLDFTDSVSLYILNSWNSSTHQSHTLRETDSVKSHEDVRLVSG